MEKPGSLKSLFRDDQRAACLEKEVLDLKLLLRESEEKRWKLQEQVDDLTGTVEELLKNASRPTSGQVVPRGTGRGNGVVVSPPRGEEQKLTIASDKTRATILALRMERVEQLRRRQQEDIKQSAIGALGVLRAFKKEWSGFKEEFIVQVARTRDTLTSIIGSATPSELASTGGAVTFPPINSHHPVAQQINALCDSMDSVIDVLQHQWYTFSCFTKGPVPLLHPARRYLDPVVNVATYTQLGAKVQQYVTFASAVNLVNSEMRLPNLMQQTSEAVMAANDEFMDVLNSLFSAIRLIRSPFKSYARSLSLALRICLTVDVSRDEVKELLDYFDGLARAHTFRCFQYICHTINLGRRFAKVQKTSQESRMRQFMLGGDETLYDGGSSGRPFHSCGVQCEGCKVWVGCDDCAVLDAHDGELRNLIEERRRLIIAFTARRIDHFAMLSKIAEKLLRVMNRYKLSAPSTGQPGQNNRKRAAQMTALSDQAQSTTALVVKAEHHIRTKADPQQRQIDMGRTGGAGLEPDISWSQSAPSRSIVPVDASKPLVGPFGETFFGADHYFRSRRAHTARDERRRVAQHNAAVLEDIVRGDILTPLHHPTKPQGTLSPRVKGPQYLSARMRSADVRET